MKRLTLYRIASSLLLPSLARNQLIGEEAEFPSGCWKKRSNFHLFSLKGRVSVYSY
jgi:hypothetical protein